MSIRISDLWLFIAVFVVMNLAVTYLLGISTPAKMSSSISSVIALGLVATFSAWRESRR